MAHTTVLHFRPGRYERVVFKLWSAPRFGGPRRIKGRYIGAVPVYCGHGWEHHVFVNGTIDEHEPSSIASDDRHRRFALLDAARKGDRDAGEELVSELVETDLDWSWEDPCDRVCDEEKVS
jgi:hypothetical protein